MTACLSLSLSRIMTVSNLLAKTFCVRPTTVAAAVARSLSVQQKRQTTHLLRRVGVASNVDNSIGKNKKKKNHLATRQATTLVVPGTDKHPHHSSRDFSTAQVEEQDVQAAEAIVSKEDEHREENKRRRLSEVRSFCRSCVWRCCRVLSCPAFSLLPHFDHCMLLLVRKH